MYSCLVSMAGFFGNQNFPEVVRKLTLVILSEEPARPLAGELRNAYRQAGRIHFLKWQKGVLLHCSPNW